MTRKNTRTLDENADHIHRLQREVPVQARS
jgi:hypothetical protein